MSNPYSDYIATLSPTVYYEFDDVSGTTCADSSGNANDGTYTAGVQLQQDGVILSGNAAYFDGDEYVNLDGVLSDPNILTVSFWLKWNKELPDSGTSIVFGHRSAPQTLIQIGVVDYNEIIVQLRSSVSSLVEFSATGLDLAYKNTFVAVVFNRSTNTHRIYINGVEANTDSTSFSGNFSATKTTIASTYSAGYFVHHIGTIDEFAMWDGTEIADTDILELYAIGVSTFELTGSTSVNGVPASTTVRLYERDTGVLVYDQTSEVDGSYVFTNINSIDYDIVCIGDETVCPQISGPLTPTIVDAPAYTGTEVLLLNFNGGNGSTMFTDESDFVHNITPNGDAVQSNTQVHEGVSSLFLDGTGDFLSVPHTPGFFSVIGDMTIEAWIYRTDDTTRDVIASKYNTFSTDGFTFQIFDNDTLGFAIGSGGYQNVVSVSTIPTGEWVHVAASKEGQVTRVFINGILENSLTTTGTPLDNTVALSIGKDSIASDRHFIGYMDEFKFTQGFAKYTADFTPV